MKKISLIISFCLSAFILNAQTMTPEMLLQLGKLNTQGITKDKSSPIIKVINLLRLLNFVLNFTQIPPKINPKTPKLPSQR